MARIRALGNQVKEWYERNFTWKGIAAFLFFLAKEIPDDFGRRDFWRAKLPSILKILSDHSTLVTVLLVAGIIWLDHRRVLKKLEKRYDPNSLKGRTLKLRDEMQSFLDSAPPATKATREMTSEEMLQTAFTDPRAPRLRHGYHLRFEDRVRAIYHEFGEFNIDEQQLVRAGFINEEDYVAVIQALTELSERPEIKN